MHWLPDRQELNLNSPVDGFLSLTNVGSPVAVLGTSTMESSDRIKNFSQLQVTFPGPKLGIYISW